MPVDSLEWWQMIVGFCTTAVTILGAGWAAWMSFKTKQWENMTKKAINESQMATETMRVSSESLHKKMDDIKATTDDVRASIDSITQKGEIETEELSTFEKEFGPRK